MGRLTALDGYRFPTIPVALAQLSVRVDTLAARLGFTARTWEEDGLGPASGAVLRLPSGRTILLMELRHAVEALGVSGPSVLIDAMDLATRFVDELVSEVVAALELTPSSVEWVAAPEAQSHAADAVAYYIDAKDDWSVAPVFGQPDPKRRGTVRPSVYAVVEDGHGRIAWVRTPTGTFLPGGGIQSDESTTEALGREAREECGWAIEVGSWRRCAIEHVYSLAEQAQFEKRCTFCDVLAVAELDVPPDADHEVLWLSMLDVPAGRYPKSHAWAVQQWLYRS